MAYVINTLRKVKIGEDVYIEHPKTNSDQVEVVRPEPTPNDPSLTEVIYTIEGDITDIESRVAINEVDITMNTQSLDTVYERLGTQEEDLEDHIEDTSNPHVVTKAQVGLDKIENKTDAEKLAADSDNPIKIAIDTKVDKVAGKGLSTNDYTTAEKSKLSGIATGAEVNVQSDWTASSGDAFIRNKPTTIAGYGITDAYTKTETNTNIAAAKSEAITSANTYTDNIAGGLTLAGLTFSSKTEIQNWIAGTYTRHDGKTPADLILGMDLYTESNADPDYWVKRTPVTSMDDLQELYTGEVETPQSIVNKYLQGGSSEDPNKLFTTSDKNKLGTIEEGAQVNVQSDWTASSGDALILHKPTTIAGFGITDAYTKTETNTNIATAKSEAISSANDYTNNATSNKVDKVAGKGLSTNDYTTAEKSKLSGIATGAEVNQPIATKEQAHAGTSNDTVMTPLRTKDSIADSLVSIKSPHWLFNNPVTYPVVDINALYDQVTNASYEGVDYTNFKVGDLVLLAAQSNKAQNGYYNITSIGTNSDTIISVTLGTKLSETNYPIKLGSLINVLKGKYAGQQLACYSIAGNGMSLWAEHSRLPTDRDLKLYYDSTENRVVLRPRLRVTYTTKADLEPTYDGDIVVCYVLP